MDGRASRRRQLLGLAFLLCAAAAASAGCARTPGARLGPARAVAHVVQPGENLYRISQRYGVTAERVMAANAIRDPRELRVGQTIMIPGVYDRVAVGSSYQANSFALPPAGYHRFQWPVEGGVISSGFGIRNGVKHDGVDISSPAGTPVRAADNGTVIFSGRLRGYGNTVIIRHDDHYVTVYGHNQSNDVSDGQAVVRGQVISRVGSTGRTNRANLHFEIRRDNLASDPLDFLAPAESGAAFARSGGS